MRVFVFARPNFLVNGRRRSAARARTSGQRQLDVLLLVTTAQPAASQGAGDAVGSGGGNLRAEFTERSVNRDRLCFSSVNHVESYPEVGSNSAYAAAYRVGDLATPVR